jgi:hypothetical protein
VLRPERVSDCAADPLLTVFGLSKIGTTAIRIVVGDDERVGAGPCRNLVHVAREDREGAGPDDAHRIGYDSTDGSVAARHTGSALAYSVKT